MGNMLVINSMLPEVRVALLEYGRLAELYIEREHERGIVGNIYRGRVVRVLPGMQAAFVDIGQEKAAFLYVGDARMAAEGDVELGEESETEHPHHHEEEGKEELRIEDILQEGQTITVQVSKDPLGTKGARLTTHITLPGRYLVYLPRFSHIGISRRIGDAEERERLRKLMEGVRPSEGGFIVRTVAEGASEEQLRRDVDFLLRMWTEIQRREESAQAPELLHYDLNVALRSIRDLCNDETERVLLDNPEEFYRVRRFLDSYMPEAQFAVELYQRPDPIFDTFGISHEISRALARKVWLKSGGYLVIDQAEALTAIDVNTGRYVGRRNLQDTILQTNLEAVQEVVYQLRLRNIGGLIIIDFIDMERTEHRDRVCAALVQALKADRAKTNVLKISELGLVEMTRKRVRESLGRTLTEPCFYCNGTGMLKSKTTICYEIFRELMRMADAMEGRTIQVNAHPSVVEQLFSQERGVVDWLEKLLNRKILIRPRESFHVERYAINSY
ncbi:Rne/Rng family ribonuclease [Myxococcota bacterium]|nr:Rne/Rng family ribonuclease [Myxococcota bacterium]